MKSMATLLLTGLLLVGCGQKVAVVTPEIEAQMLSDLRAGRANLDCWFACAATWGGDLSELNVRYTTEDWTHLATLVMQIGFQEDLAYFYLGRAAEGLGAPEAAVRYYRIAGALATGSESRYKCNGAGLNLCNGLSFPSDLYPRIQIAENAVYRANPRVHRPMAKPKVASATSHATASSTASPAAKPGGSDVVPASASGGDEAWIDPPPVTH